MDIHERIQQEAIRFRNKISCNLSKKNLSFEELEKNLIALLALEVYFPTKKNNHNQSDKLYKEIQETLQKYQQEWDEYRKKRAEREAAFEEKP